MTQPQSHQRKAHGEYPRPVHLVQQAYIQALSETPTIERVLREISTDDLRVMATSRMLNTAIWLELEDRGVELD